MDEIRTIKCVAIGDGYVGKTSLLSRLSGKPMDECYLSTIFENSKVAVNYKNENYELFLIDTAGQEDYNFLRTQAYSYGDIFLLCYSVDNMDSFINVRETWLPDVSNCKENAKFLLVGLKSDLRTDPETIDRLNISKRIFVSKGDAENMSTKLGIPHIECSAKEQENFDEIRNKIIELGKTVNTMDSEYYSYSCSLITAIKRAFCCND
ncbi:hypothetical protein HHI36_005561 [Cryptolaemus montrouzieri]|uniref:Uncharacterized protein n=1 Tax=Cryptolaemus montrouzieri TaxID=559131 RepID=A0ABD2NUR0_9CUCU